VAKAKSTNSSDTSSARRPQSKPVTLTKGREPAIATKPALTTPSAISNDEIGRVAGQLWHLLDKGGAQNVAALKKAIDAPADLTLAAIGWLAREDKLEFSNSGRTVKISLRS
jgi:hypothetical protein